MLESVMGRSWVRQLTLIWENLYLCNSISTWLQHISICIIIA